MNWELPLILWLNNFLNWVHTPLVSYKVYWNRRDKFKCIPKDTLKFMGKEICFGEKIWNLCNFSIISIFYELFLKSPQMYLWVLKILNSHYPYSGPICWWKNFPLPQCINICIAIWGICVSEKLVKDLSISPYEKEPHFESGKDNQKSLIRARTWQWRPRPPWQNSAASEWQLRK